MARGSVEIRRSGFRARVYAGKDPVTHRQMYLRGENRRTRAEAEADIERLLALADTGEKVELKRTVASLLDRWMETVDHELSTAETSAGYIRRTIKPALGEMPIRKLQHRVDILDKLYSHLRRCNRLCTGPMAGRSGPRDPAVSERELTGHDSDTDVLGPAPAPGQAEAFAAYRAAWRIPANGYAKPRAGLRGATFSRSQRFP
jgi:hypothetical protein